jgi:hypothetical protein
VKPLFALGLVAALAGCGGGSEEKAANAIPSSIAANPTVMPSAAGGYGTPVKDRVATLGLLNKRNNEEQDLVLKTGEARRVGNVIVKLATCERTAPWEHPEEQGAFVQVWVQQRATTQEKLAWHKIFSGWLFKNSPSLNVVQHPVYDGWIKNCAMKFPGEEEGSAARASPSSAAKPSGRPGGTSSPAAAASASPISGAA